MGGLEAVTHCFQSLIGIVLKKAPRAPFHMRSRVSGFRFFSASIRGDDGACSLEMYDFSARSLRKWVRRTNDGRQVMHPSEPGHHLPWDAVDIYDISFGHDCILVQLVSHPQPRVRTGGSVKMTT